MKTSEAYCINHFKRMMILYLGKKSDTEFHNHMWKTLKRKLDGIAKAVWDQELPFIFFNPPQNTIGGGEKKKNHKNLPSATISEVRLASNMQKPTALYCHRLNYADNIRAGWAILGEFPVLLPILCWFMNK